MNEVTKNMGTNSEKGANCYRVFQLRKSFTSVECTIERYNYNIVRPTYGKSQPPSTVQHPQNSYSYKIILYLLSQVHSNLINYKSQTYQV